MGLTDLKSAFGHTTNENNKIVDEEISKKVKTAGDAVDDSLEEKMTLAIKGQYPDLSDEQTKSLVKITGFYINSTKELNENMTTDEAVDVMIDNAYIGNTFKLFENITKASIRDMSLPEKLEFGINAYRLKEAKNYEDFEKIATTMFESIDSHISETNREILNEELQNMDISMEDLKTVLTMAMKEEEQIGGAINVACETYEMETGDPVVNIENIKSPAPNFKNDKELNKIIEQNMKQRVAPTNDVKHMATRGTEFDYIAEKQNEQQISME